MTVCVFESEAFCANAASFIQNGYGAHLSADTDFMPAKIDARSHHQFPGSSSSVPRKVSMRASSMLHPRRRVAKSYPRDFANPTQCDIYSGKKRPQRDVNSVHLLAAPVALHRSTGRCVRPKQPTGGRHRSTGRSSLCARPIQPTGGRRRDRNSPYATGTRQALV